MRILILTQTVDSTHPVLGFFHQWILAWANVCTQVTVIGLEVGTYDVPNNVSVHSLGKEAGKGRLTYLWRFYTLAWKLRHEYDCVFVHMNPEYVVLGAPLWRMMGKRVALWYTHKSVDAKLRVAVRMAHVIFTASAESFRIASPKVQVVGHGIDTALFSPPKGMRGGTEHVRSDRVMAPLRMLAVGRVTPTKRLDMILDALACVCATGVPAELTIVGAPFAKEDGAYERTLRDRVRTGEHASVVHFAGAVSPGALPNALRAADMLVHACEGGLDKVVLEALACGVPIVSTSEAVQAVLPEALRALQPKGHTPGALCEAILHVAHLSADERHRVSNAGVEWVGREHALPARITTITAAMGTAEANRRQVSSSHARTRAVRGYVKTLAYLFAWMGGWWVRDRGGALVLMYHSVSRGNGRWSVDPEVLERQVRYLAKHRTIVPLSRVVAYTQGKGELPKGAVALTFDDGYKDTYTEVLPVLKKYRVPATLFLTTDLSPMETLGTIPRPTWDEVRALHTSGLVDIQVHGRGHVSAHALDPQSEEFREQFLGCADDIAREVGERPSMVAYPYGDKTRAHADAVRAMGFAVAFGTHEGVVQKGTHPFALPRVSVERGMSHLLFMLRTYTRVLNLISQMRILRCIRLSRFR